MPPDAEAPEKSEAAKPEPTPFEKETAELMQKIAAFTGVPVPAKPDAATPVPPGLHVAIAQFAAAEIEKGRQERQRRRGGDLGIKVLA